MKRTKKVITSAKFRTNESSAVLHSDSRTRALAIGGRIDESQTSSGLIGKVNEHCGGKSLLDHGVWLDLAFPHVIGVFGTRGTGKSFDLGVIAESVAGLAGVVSGRPPSTAVVIFDIQNQFWTLALQPDRGLPEDLQQLSDLKEWGLGRAGLSDVNLWLPAGLQSTLPDTRIFRLSPDQLQESDWLAALELERYSAMGQALLTLLNSEGSRQPSVLANRAIPSPGLNAFQQSTIDALRWRLLALADSSLIQEPGVDVRELLVPGRVSVLLLRELEDGLRALIAGVLMRLFSARMGSFHLARRVNRRLGAESSEEDLPERLWTFIDEAHVIAPKLGSTAASTSVVDYVKRGRDAGLSIVFATQQPSAVDDRLMSQVDVTLTHSLGFDSDLQAAMSRMPTRTSITYERAGFPLPSLADTIRSLDSGEAVVADAANGRIFLARIRPRLSAHGGNTPTTAKFRDDDASRLE